MSESRPGPRNLRGPLHSDEIVIGLALGSPRENPLPLLPRADCADYSLPPLQKQDLDFVDALTCHTQNSPTGEPERTTRSNTGLKRSGSRWKGFGGFFGKKTPSAPSFDGQPFYMLDQTNQQDWAKPKRTPASPEDLSAPSLRRRANTNEGPTSETLRRSDPAHQKGAKAMLRRASTRRRGIRKRGIDETRASRPRAHTGPILESQRELSAGNHLKDQKGPVTQAQEDASPSWVRVGEDGLARNHDDALDFEQTGEQEVLKKQAGASSFLQVEIPSVELERYSVMFGDLLSPPTSRSPSSVAYRRQSRSPRRKIQLGERRIVADGKENLHKTPLASNPPRPVHGRTHSSSSTASKSSTKSTATFSLFPPPGPPQKRNEAHKPLPRPSPLSRSVTAPYTATMTARPTITTSRPQDPTHLMIIVHEANSPTPPTEEGRLHQRKTSLEPSSVALDSTRTSSFEYPVQSIEINYPTSRSSTPNGEVNEKVAKRDFPVRKSSMKAPRVPMTTSLRSHSPPKAPFALEKTDSVSSEGETVSVAVARQVSMSRRQRNLVPIVPQVARQPMQVKLINSCSTPQLRKSHHLTLEDM